MNASERERTYVLLPFVDCGHESDVPSRMFCLQFVWSSHWREGSLHTLVCWQVTVVSNVHTRPFFCMDWYGIRSGLYQGTHVPWGTPVYKARRGSSLPKVDIVSIYTAITVILHGDLCLIKFLLTYYTCP